MPEHQDNRFYVTTPIYYVNDRPHIGHVYTTAVADVLARYHRLKGDDTFFLTGTDEHASKVSNAAAEKGLTPIQWADENAEVFQKTFERLGMTHDDFIRTTEPRHTQKVTEYITALLQPVGDDEPDVYQGTYEGWYDPGEEEYVPESRAREHEYKSPVSGRGLVKRSEENWYFRLSKYRAQVAAAINDGTFTVMPEARKNEILRRLETAEDVPISRAGESTQEGGWGIPMPGPDGKPTGHTIYVWIDALFNYLTTVDSDELRKYWEGDGKRGGATHLIAKDILWFHAAIWPAVLLALRKRAGYDWVRLPKCVYAHSFWISEGAKMSKSLGNFIDLEKIDGYIEKVGGLGKNQGDEPDVNRGLDALRYFLATQGPMGTTDADFAEDKFFEVYNSDLANTFGNSCSRVSNMIGKYCGGVLGTEREGYFQGMDGALMLYRGAFSELRMSEAGVQVAIRMVSNVDQYIEEYAPFKLAKDPEMSGRVNGILYNCIEALRIASILLWPFIPNQCEEFWSRIGCDYKAQMDANGGLGRLDEWVKWGQLQPGTKIEKGDALFPRYQGK